ncbi:MAG TPA: ROK family transcriptional regulator [Chryseolinea sp.]|nr:ROK family transcriptional regulator [Chryseolinea sp.]
MEFTGNKKMSARLMNKINTTQVLSVIRSQEFISRAEICRVLGLTAPTVNKILAQLAESGFVEYIGHGKSGGGRPPMLIKFNGKNNFVIGIDIGATTIRGVLSNLDAEFILEIQLSTKLKSGESGVMEQIFSLVDRLFARKNFNGAKVLGIGIGVPGLIDHKKGIIDLSPDFGWKNMEFHRRLSERIKLPIVFDNSTRLMAVGEKKYGKGMELDDYIVVNVGYGIAAGIVANGKILGGARGHAGEFGHIVIDPHSDVLCDCGGKGHLEALSSGRRIADLRRLLLTNNVDKDLKKLSEDKASNVTAKMIADLARQGNPNAIRIFDSALHYLSIGIVNMINVFDPKKVLIGGGVALNGDIFFDNLNKLVSKNMMSAKKIQIEPVSFGENATLVGACALVLEGLLNFDISIPK